jgi:hypothetical protein
MNRATATTPPTPAVANTTTKERCISHSIGFGAELCAGQSTEVG